MAKITLILDTRKVSNVVKLRISSSQAARYISLGIRIENEAYWQPLAAGGPIVGCLNAKTYNALIKARLSAAIEVKAQMELAKGRRGVILDDLVRAIRERIDPDSIAAEELSIQEKKVAENGVLAHYLRVMATYQGRTWEIYETTLRRIREYAEDICGDQRKEDYDRISRGGVPSEPAQQYLMHLEWSDINAEWLQGWVDSMSDTKGPSTQSIYLRTFRHVCTDAYKHELAERDPYRFFTIPKAEGDVQPLTEDEFASLFRQDLTGADDVRRYRDMAWFGFCTIGTNMVDIHKLTWDNIRNGYMHYTRSKTGRKYSIKLEPEALHVMGDQGTDRQPGRKVFQWAEKYRSHTNYVKHLNQTGLQRVGPHVTQSGEGTQWEKRQFFPILPKCHYYQLRHTWATFAHALGISKDTIALCLGHGKRTVTDTYIRYEQREIDEANRKVIDYAISLIK